ncbi:phage tail family protein [Listeria monocytogenes]|nr:phage tail family protein [Listeria monocytogenes]
MLNKMYIYKPDTREKIVITQKNVGFSFLKHRLSSPNLVTEYIQFDNTDGAIDVPGVFRSKIISCDFVIKNKTYFEFFAKQQDIIRLFFERNAYYISFEMMPGIWYLVKPLPFNLDRFGKHGIFTIDFDVFKGHGESLATTMSDFTFSENEWQLGQGIAMEDYKYKFMTNNFIIYNAGDLEIDPRKNKLLVTLSGKSDGSIRISNITTGDTFIYKLPMTATDTLTIDNAIPKMNGIPCGRNTNHGLISLAKGENEIEIKNMSYLSTSWDFSYLYM